MYELFAVLQVCTQTSASASFPRGITASHGSPQRRQQPDHRRRIERPRSALDCSIHNQWSGGCHRSKAWARYVATLDALLHGVRDLFNGGLEVLVLLLVQANAFCESFEHRAESLRSIVEANRDNQKHFVAGHRSGRGSKRLSSPHQVEALAIE